MVFLVGTVLITWALYLPIPLLGWNPYSFPGVILLFFGGSAPSWFGMILMFATYDREARGEFFRRIYQVKRTGLIGWLVPLLLFPAIVAASIAFNVALGGAMPGMATRKPYSPTRYCCFLCSV